MNRYLVKAAKLIDLMPKPGRFIHGGTDQLEAMRNTRAVALKSLKSVPKDDHATRKYLMGAYRAIQKDNLGTGGAMQGLEQFIGS